MPAISVDYTFGDVTTLAPLTTIRTEAGEPFVLNLSTADSSVTSLVGVPLEVVFSRFQGFTPEFTIPDARFSAKAVNGTAVVTTISADTSDYGGRAWFATLRHQTTKEVLRTWTHDIGGASTSPSPPTGIALPNTVRAGPSSGTAAGEEAFRHLVPLDLPGVSAAAIYCLATAGDLILSPLLLSGASYANGTLTIDLSSYTGVVAGATLSIADGGFDVDVDGNVAGHNAVFSGTTTVTLKGYGETAVNLSTTMTGTITANFASGNVQYGTLTGATTLVFSNPPTSGTAGTLTLVITGDGTHAITWPASVDWGTAGAPATLGAGSVTVFSFLTLNGGTKYRASYVGGFT